jgi:hypothetical protein
MVFLTKKQRHEVHRPRMVPPTPPQPRCAQNCDELCPWYDFACWQDCYDMCTGKTLTDIYPGVQSPGAVPGLRTSGDPVPARPNPSLAAISRPTTRFERRARSRMLWRNPMLARSPVLITNPSAARVLIAVLAAAGLGYGAYRLFGTEARAAVVRTPPPMTEDEAVEAALQRGGSRDQMANMAYWASHPECPTKLDSGNPTHAGCVQVWRRLRDKIAARQTGQKKPGKSPPPPSPQDECDPLDPTTWGAGNICFHDGTRWKRVPEAAPPPATEEKLARTKEEAMANAFVYVDRWWAEDGKNWSDDTWEYSSNVTMIYDTEAWHGKIPDHMVGWQCVFQKEARRLGREPLVQLFSGTPVGCL